MSVCSTGGVPRRSAAMATKTLKPTDHYTIISADTHAGGSHAQYREYLDAGVPRRLRRVAQQVQEPVQGPARHERARPQLGQRAPVERRGARRRRRRGDLPEHGAAVLPELRPLRRAAAARGLRAPARRDPRAQPLAGRLLRRVPGAARRRRADLPQRHRRRDRRRQVDQGARPARRASCSRTCRPTSTG